MPYNYFGSLDIILNGLLYEVPCINTKKLNCFLGSIISKDVVFTTKCDRGKSLVLNDDLSFFDSEVLFHAVEKLFGASNFKEKKYTSVRFCFPVVCYSDSITDVTTIIDLYDERACIKYIILPQDRVLIISDRNLSFYSEPRFKLSIDFINDY